MRAASLDLSRERDRIPPWQWVALALGILAVLWVSIEYAQLSRSNRALEQRLADFQQQRPAAMRSATVDAATLREIEAANGIAARLTLPWEALFHEIEVAQTAEIALLAISPNVARRSVQLDGEARNADATLEYIAALEAQPALASVSLLSHEIRQEDAEKPVRFSIQARWVLP